MNPNQNPNRPGPQPARKFDVNPAVFNGTSLYVGLVGPSGSGKTKSAFEIAKGIQAVTGDKTAIIDTENERALHYVNEYQYSWQGGPGLFHIPFHPPFQPSAYQAACEAAVRAGIKIVIVDSYTHEHEGVGGVLEMHDEAIARGIKDPSAWGPAKAERLKMTNFVLQTPGVHWIFCYRAKEKKRWIAGRPPEDRGLMPLGNESFIFESTCNFLLPAGANGVPVLRSPYPDEELIIKVPQQYRHLFTEPRQLSAALGMHLAAWAVPSFKGTLPPLPAPMDRGQSASVSYTSQVVTVSGPIAPTTTAVTAVRSEAALVKAIDELIAEYGAAPTFDAMDELLPRYQELFAQASDADKDRMRAGANACVGRLEAATPPTPTPTPTTPVTQPTTATSTTAAPTAAPPVVVPPSAPQPSTTAVNAAMDAFRNSLNSLGEVITWDQAATLVRDHNLSIYSEKDRLAAQHEIMDRTQPPFVNVSQLKVHVRHLENCDAYPAYKSFCADLALCTTSAENVFECWTLHGEAVDKLPDVPNADARTRASRQVEIADPSIAKGGPWLTARIKAAKAAAKPDAATTNGATNGANGSTNGSTNGTTNGAHADVQVHAPLTSDISQKLALELEQAKTVEMADAVKTKAERAKLQKRGVSDGELNTLLGLWEAKVLELEPATA